MASMAISICRSSSQAFTASILSCTRACSASSFSMASSSSGSAKRALISSNFASSCRVPATACFDIAAHVRVGVEHRLLRHVADGETVGQPGLAVEFLVDAGHDPQQGAFARAVAPQHADLGAGVKGQPNVLEHFALADASSSVRRSDRCIACSWLRLLIVWSWLCASPSAAQRGVLSRKGGPGEGRQARPGGMSVRRAVGSRRQISRGRRYSHSIVAGGLELMSYTTRFTPLTSLMMRVEMRASRS